MTTNYLDLFPEIRNIEIYKHLDDLSKMVYNYVFHPRPLPEGYRPIVPLSYEELVLLMGFSNKLYDFFENYSPSKDIIKTEDLGLAAARSGNLTVLKEHIQKFDKSRSRISIVYYEGIIGGNFSVITYLYDKSLFNISEELWHMAYKLAGRENNLTLIEWLSTQHNVRIIPREIHPVMRGAIQGAIRGKSVNFIYFLMEKGYLMPNFHPENKYDFSTRLDILTFLISICYLTEENILSGAIESDNAEIVSFLLQPDMNIDTKFLTDHDDDALYEIRKELGFHNNIEIIKLLIEKKILDVTMLSDVPGYLYSEKQSTLVEDRASTNLIDALYTLCKDASTFTYSRMSWDVYWILVGALNKDKWKVVEFFHTFGALPKESSLCEMAYSAGAYRSYWWLIEHGYPLSKICGDIAISRGDYHEFKVVEKYCGSTLDQSNALTCAIAGLILNKNYKKQLECINWLLKRGCNFDESIFLPMLIISSFHDEILEILCYIINCGCSLWGYEKIFQTLDDMRRRIPVNLNLNWVYVGNIIDHSHYIKIKDTLLTTIYKVTERVDKELTIQHEILKKLYKLVVINTDIR